LLHEAPGSLSPLPAIWASDRGFHGRHKSVRIVRRAKPSAFRALYDSWYPVHRRGNYRETGSDGLEKAQREPFEIRWQREDVQPVQEPWNIVTKTAKFYRIGQTLVTDLLLQIRFQRPAAEKSKPNIAAPAAEQSKRFDQDAMILLRRHSSSEAEYNLVPRVPRGHGKERSQIDTVVHDKPSNARHKKPGAEKRIHFRAHGHDPVAQQSGSSEQCSAPSPEPRMVEHRGYVNRIYDLHPACGSSSQRAIQIVVEGIVDVQNVGVRGKQSVPEFLQQTCPA
jgi:hypothetical protein